VGIGGAAGSRNEIYVPLLCVLFLTRA